jgi:hypothetical protein
VEQIRNDGNMAIICPSGVEAEIGARFYVINDSDSPIAEIKIIKVDSSGAIARSFKPFTPGPRMTRAAASGVGAALGSFLNAPVTGAVIGAAIGSALAGISSASPIQVGMRIISAEGDDILQLPSADDQGGDRDTAKS